MLIRKLTRKKLANNFIKGMSLKFDQDIVLRCNSSVQGLHSEIILCVGLAGVVPVSHPNIMKVFPEKSGDFFLWLRLLCKKKKVVAIFF